MNTEKLNKKGVLRVAYKIAMACQKGGVGKTTSSVILSEILAASGYRVLVLDLDPQGNSSRMMTGRSIYDFSGKTILEAMKEEDARGYAVQTKENLSIIPAEDMLSTFSRYLYTNKISNPLHVLKQTMKSIEDQYDFIIMDAPPNLGEAVLNAIVYADGIIVPAQMEPFGMEGLNRFLEFVQEAKDAGHTNCELLGILLTMKDSRTAIGKAISQNIRSRYGNLVFDTEIRLRARVKEFSLEGVQFDGRNDMDALEDYIEATKEVVSRVKKR